MNPHQQILFLTRKVKEQDGIITPTETKQLAALLTLSHDAHLAAETHAVRLREELREAQQTLADMRCNLT